MIYFTSDLHFHHKNITRGLSVWPKAETRDFEDEVEMTDHLIDQINKTVKVDDTLYFLGDWSFGAKENVFLTRSRINCKQIYFIYGNHDERIVNNKDVAPVGSKKTIQPEDLFTVLGWFHEDKIMGQRISMCHYPLRVWNKSHKGAWMLHGHCHDTLEPSYCSDPFIQMANRVYKDYRTLDVGVDSAKRILGEYRPFSFNEIHQILYSRKDTEIDQHQPNR